MSNIITEELKDALREPKYKKFQGRLTRSSLPMEGIRTDKLRSAAIKLAAEYPLSEFIGIKPLTVEELTVIGLIVAYKDIDIENKFDAIDYFLTINDNWFTNDTVISTLKNKSEIYFKYLMNMMHDGGWRSRFSITSLLWNFLDKEHIDTIFEGFYKINYGDYYVDMAVAWFLSKAYLDYQDKVEDFYETAPLNKLVLKTTVTKIRDIVGMPRDKKERMEEILKDVLCKREMY